MHVGICAGSLPCSVVWYDSDFVWIKKLAKFPNAHFILSYKELNNMKYRFKGRNKMTSVGTLVNQ
ncbi:hypothetical protein T4B_4354 [Trichinella pseudospiralis]|uniref:Uncharacterized protein n=1 Tax=Trichinella pseudospiralis TaxID=6337 RepID=A0A0V1K093_TRIPS|nr:hypothetical protein T4A_7787 [Trichinella pseudospiralis]KRZ21961.1 hypothetical protein T4B_4354 [Trichinella pseudospiralis]KRZ40605.1 hypothetical protein T4C_12445 [Trichinella pseudospiralis]